MECDFIVYTHIISWPKGISRWKDIQYGPQMHFSIQKPKIPYGGSVAFQEMCSCFGQYHMTIETSHLTWKELVIP